MGVRCCVKGAQLIMNSRGSSAGCQPLEMKSPVWRADAIWGEGGDVLRKDHCVPGGVSARLLRRCCDTHRVRRAAPTGRMAFLSRGYHGSSSRDFDGRDWDAHMQVSAVSRWDNNRGDLLCVCFQCFSAMTKQVWLLEFRFFFLMFCIYFHCGSLCGSL